MIWLLLLLLVLPARAHVGAPYLVLLDEPVGTQKLSVWSDPDVGKGSFYLVVNQGTPPGAQLWVTPKDGHRPEEGPYTTAPQEWARKPSQATFIPFDRAGDWTVRLETQGHSITFPVQVTPPGPSWFAWALGLGPCLLLAIFWWWGAQRARKKFLSPPK